MIAAVWLSPLVGCFSEKSVRFQPQRSHDAATPIAAPANIAKANPDSSSEMELVSAAADSAAAPARSPASAAREISTRQWLEVTQAALAAKLPNEKETSLTTMRLCDASYAPIDTSTHFNVDPAKLHTLLHNYSGIMHTAQAAGTGTTIDKPAPPWPGFEDVWVPMPHDANGLEL
ncbi:MAG: hypothetical protein AB7N71_09965, partial [Phycisphaerae bacterium]